MRAINWTAAGVIVTAVAALVGGVWTAFVYFDSHKQGDELRVCRGDDKGKCWVYDRFIGCSTLQDWAKGACKSSYEFINKDSDVSGGQCGTALYRVKCK